MNNKNEYKCPICGADNMCTDFTDGFKWGRAYCNSCDCAGPEVHTGYEESLDAPWREEARKQFSDVANEYANKPLADANVARSPWVKTADRLPAKADGEILAINKYGLNLLPYYRVVELSDVYTWWMAIPPLPEVEE